MGFGNKGKALVSSPDVGEVYRENLKFYTGGSTPAAQPEDMDKAMRLAGNAAEEAVQDGVRYDGFISPERAMHNAALDFGSDAVAQHFHNEMFRHMQGLGRRSSAFKKTFTGNAPTVVLPTPVLSQHMGEGSRVAVTQVRPSHIAENLIGDPDQTKRVLTRLELRNQPLGADNAAVYHRGNLQETLERPFLVYRDTKNDFDHTDGTVGYAEPVSRSIFFNALTDHAYERPRSYSTTMNVAQHEGIHSILHGELYSPQHDRALRYTGKDPETNLPFKNPHARAAVAGINHGGLDRGSAYTASDTDEIANLLFHTKRLTETVEPGMRDVGENMGTLDNWLDYIRNYKRTGEDPIINRPGHPNEGGRAHGYESQIQTLQDILRNADKDALDDIRDINFKTGQVPTFREALLG
jgi:hypothetical protein